MRHYTVTIYGCKEWLCRTGRIRGELVYHRPLERMTMANIKAAICERFGLSMIDLTSDRRSREVARPRQVSMYLCKQLTRKSLPQIGRCHGDRDHTTVMHAIRQVEKFRLADSEIDAAIVDISAALQRPQPVGETAR